MSDNKKSLTYQFELPQQSAQYLTSRTMGVTGGGPCWSRERLSLCINPVEMEDAISPAISVGFCVGVDYFHDV